MWILNIKDLVTNDQTWLRSKDYTTMLRQCQLPGFDAGLYLYRRTAFGSAGVTCQLLLNVSRRFFWHWLAILHWDYFKNIKQNEVASSTSCYPVTGEGVGPLRTWVVLGSHSAKPQVFLSSIHSASHQQQWDTVFPFLWSYETCFAKARLWSTISMKTTFQAENQKYYVNFVRLENPQ